MERYRPLIVLAVFISLVSCKKDPAGVPSYIYIPDIQLSTTITEGSNSDDIIDAWVYVNDNPVGCFPLPARVPILAEGPVKLSIFGGIKADGINSRRRRYIFYQPFVQNDLVLRRGEVDTMQGSLAPVVTYFPSTEINMWYEDFSDPFVPFFQDALSDTSMVRVTNPGEVFEGTGCGLLTLAADQIYVKVATAELFDLPKGGSPVFVEFNYKANYSFAVGLTSISPGNTIHQDNTIVRETYDENGNLVWKKIYCEFTDLVSSNINAVSHEIYFKLFKDQGGSIPLVYIDNVRLVYGN